MGTGIVKEGQLLGREEFDFLAVVRTLYFPRGNQSAVVDAVLNELPFVHLLHEL